MSWPILWAGKYVDRQTSSPSRSTAAAQGLQDTSVWGREADPTPRCRLNKLRRTAAKAFAKNNFINQERKSVVWRQSETVVFLTINDANWRFAGVELMTPWAASGKPKFWLPGEVWMQSWNLKELMEGHHQEWSLQLNLTQDGENSPGLDTVRIDRFRAVSWFSGWWSNLSSFCVLFCCKAVSWNHLCNLIRKHDPSYRSNLYVDRNGLNAQCNAFLSIFYIPRFNIVSTKAAWVLWNYVKWRLLYEFLNVDSFSTQVWYFVICKLSLCDFTVLSCACEFFHQKWNTSRVYDEAVVVAGKTQFDNVIQW